MSRPEAFPDLLSAATRANPYPLYARLRREAPVHVDSDHGHWLISRYEDVTRVLKAPDAFSTIGVASFERSLLGNDPPRHTVVRRALERYLDLREPTRWESRFRSLVRRAFEASPRGHEIDVVATMASVLPFQIVLDVVGGVDADPGAIRQWAHAMVEESPFDSERLATLRASFLSFVRDHVDRVLKGEVNSPWQVALARELGEPALADVVGLLLVAGTETTANLIGMLVLLLTSQPGLLERCRTRAELIPGVIEETLRLESPVQWTRRVARRSVSLAGCEIPAGAQVLALIGSANRDEAKFARADVFDLARPATGHIAFGYGPHFCLGSQLARMEGRVFLQELASNWTTVQRADDAPLEWLPAPQIRGLRRLTVVPG
jgi:cytochrome P450